MLDLTEAQMVELILVAARRGYKQAVDDAKRKAAEERTHYAQEGVDAYRQQALALLRKRLGELRELKASELLVAGFNEAVEYLECGVDREWADVKKGPAKGA